MRITRTVLCTVVAVAAAALASSATALDLDANIEGIYTDDTFSTLVDGQTIDANGDATVSLSPGQGVIVAIDVDNPSAQTIDAIFATILTDTSQVTFLGGSALASLLEGGTVVNPTALNRVSQPVLKGNSPSLDEPPSTEEWVQGIAYAAQGGTDGTGPVSEAVMIFFEVADVSPDEEIVFEFTTTSGDAINSPDEGDILESTTFENATINVPEPGMVALALAGLGTVAVAIRTRRQNA